MENFIIGVGSSLVASIIILLIAGRKFQAKFLRVFVSRLFRHGVEYQYENQREAEADMASDFATTKNIKIMVMRGFSFSHATGPFNFVLSDQMRHKIDVRILVADPRNGPNGNINIAKRGEEYPGASTDIYKADVLTSVMRLKTLDDRDNIECRLHSIPSCHRLYICDQHAYISFFHQGISGAQLPIIQVRQGTPLYEGMLRHFEQTWENAKPIKSFELGQLPHALQSVAEISSATTALPAPTPGA